MKNLFSPNPNYPRTGGKSGKTNFATDGVRHMHQQLAGAGFSITQKPVVTGKTTATKNSNPDTFYKNAFAAAEPGPDDRV